MNTTMPTGRPQRTRSDRARSDPSEMEKISMSTEKNVQTVKDFFAAMGRGDKQGLLALVCRRHRVDHSGRGLAAGRHAPRARGIGGCASEGVRRRWKRHTQAPRIRGAGRPGPGRRLSPRGRSKPRISRSRTTGSSPSPFETARLTNIREYIDTQALARASQMDASGPA